MPNTPKKRAEQKLRVKRNSTLDEKLDFYLANATRTENGCLITHLNSQADGLPVISFKEARNNRSLPRLILKRHLGRELVSGKILPCEHSKKCINPEHLSEWRVDEKATTKICIVCKEAFGRARYGKKRKLETLSAFLKRKRCENCTQGRRAKGSLKELVEFFLERCEITPEGCMLPVGISRDIGGYANVSYKGKTRKLHRLVLKHKLGRPIREGYESIHSHICEDRRDCINPKHLKEGTHSENIKMAYEAGRKTSPFKKGESQQTRLVDKETADRVRQLYALGLNSQQGLADLLGVSRTTINNIVNRKMHYRDDKPTAQ